MSEQQFKGQKLLVIGGTSGIGLETAKKVAEQGGTVVIVGNRADKAETARKQLVAMTSEEQVFALTADLTNFDSVQKLISKLDSEHKDINLLVNSAGIFYPKSFLEHSLSDYNNFLDLNRAFFFITQQVASSMVAQNKEGSIVNVSAV
ncbi:SDR family NAD(P)-dependent oxidoreductase, partial [Acinetobacter calcoaceticus]